MLDAELAYGVVYFIVIAEPINVYPERLDRAYSENVDIQRTIRII